jgi:hypothetical protein
MGTGEHPHARLRLVATCFVERRRLLVGLDFDIRDAARPASLLDRLD